MVYFLLIVISIYLNFGFISYGASRLKSDNAAEGGLLNSDISEHEEIHCYKSAFFINIEMVVQNKGGRNLVNYDDNFAVVFRYQSDAEQNYTA